MRVNDWLVWRGTRTREDAQRRELGLPEATGPAPRRIAERGSLEIQAYDQVYFPGLAAEWAKWMASDPLSARWQWSCRRRPMRRSREITGVKTTGLLRVWQYSGRISGRHDRDDRRGLRPVR